MKLQITMMVNINKGRTEFSVNNRNKALMRCSLNVVNLRKYRKFNKKHLTIGKKMQPRYRY